MKRKIITMEVETEATNAAIRKGLKGFILRVHHKGKNYDSSILQVTVNDVTSPKAAKKKARKQS
jgi:hypothetical protein